LPSAFEGPDFETEAELVDDPGRAGEDRQAQHDAQAAPVHSGAASSASPLNGSVRPAVSLRAAATVGVSIALAWFPHWPRMWVSTAAISASCNWAPKAGIAPL